MCILRICSAKETAQGGGLVGFACVTLHVCITYTFKVHWYDMCNMYIHHLYEYTKFILHAYFINPLLFVYIHWIYVICIFVNTYLYMHVYLYIMYICIHMLTLPVNSRHIDSYMYMHVVSPVYMNLSSHSIHYIRMFSVCSKSAWTLNAL